MKKIALLLLPLLGMAQQFDLQGHRGCRGLLPENTIEAMKKAIDIGVTTLEMDVVISKDGKVVVSHEPFLSHEICLDYTNKEITEATEQSYNLYQMNYNEIKACDCGSKIHPRFLEQQKIKTYKPLLTEVIDTVERYLKEKYPNRKLFYNIETKTTPEGDRIFHPEPKEFVDKLMAVLKEKKILSKTFIQSFDTRTLKYLHHNYRGIKTILLVENKENYLQNLKNLGYAPKVYSPDFHLLTKEIVNDLHHKKIKVIPWTVNSIEDMQSVITLGVDGLITDYPNRYFELKK
ncbi:glycerophosphodiester phosphodiesterase [Flavobacterium sp.]|uniref:glycerophosphodiester phosphodiesterase n=1 Tax=Flavobacterium sp. TaxID=239 RepID=UPI003D103183